MSQTRFTRLTIRNPRLAEPQLYLADHADELVILDEIQRAPGIFEALRGTIDQGKREGRGVGRFLATGPRRAIRPA